MDYKILSANSATGITREGKPWTKVNLLLQRTDNNEQENVIASSFGTSKYSFKPFSNTFAIIFF